MEYYEDDLWLIFHDLSMNILIGQEFKTEHISDNFNSCVLQNILINFRFVNNVWLFQFYIFNNQMRIDFTLFAIFTNTNNFNLSLVIRTENYWSILNKQYDN